MLLVLGIAVDRRRLLWHQLLRLVEAVRLVIRASGGRGGRTEHRLAQVLPFATGWSGRGTWLRLGWWTEKDDDDRNVVDDDFAVLFRLALLRLACQGGCHRVLGPPSVRLSRYFSAAN